MLENIRKIAMKQVDQAKCGTWKHNTQKDKWCRATKDEPICGVHKNARVAQLYRDASTIAQ